MADPGLQIRGGGGGRGGHPHPEIRGGGGVSKKIFSALRASFWSRSKKGGLACENIRFSSLFAAKRPQRRRARRNGCFRRLGGAGRRPAEPLPWIRHWKIKGPGKTAIEPHSFKIFKEMLSRLSILRIGKTCFLFSSKELRSSLPISMDGLSIIHAISRSHEFLSERNELC